MSRFLDADLAYVQLDGDLKPTEKCVRKAGTCKPGQRADLTNCTPASGQSGAKKPARKPEKLGAVNTVRYGSYRVSYSVHNRKKIDGPSLALPNYQQQDEHSCGFVAALTLSRYFDKDIPAEAVLRAVKPTVSGGIDRRSLVKALKELGVDPVYTEDLTVPKLRAYVDRGIPVAVTMWLEDYDTDHWTVVQGFDGDRIHLTNYGSLTIAQFRQDWYTPGLGLVCRRKPEKSIVNRLVVKQQSGSTIAAGLAVVASDTGRVLMIQRPLGSGNDGKWEFPGGHIEDGEKPFAAAWREWLEETGLPMRGGLDANIAIDAYGNQWASSDGKYVGFVAHVPSEDTFDLNKRDLFSDPDSEVGGVIAWVHPRDLPNHNLRPALLNDVDEVLARITKWLLGQVTKSSPVNRLVQKAPCEQGETAAQTDCTPASGEGGGSSPVEAIQERLDAFESSISKLKGGLVIEEARADLRDAKKLLPKLGRGDSLNLGERLLLQRVGVLDRSTPSGSVPVKPGLEIPTQKEAEKFGQKVFGRWASSLSADEADAIDEYVVGEGYQGINESLRSDGPLTPAIAALDAALAKAVVPEAMIVYRAVRGNAVAFKVGDVVIDNGFMSTSITKRGAEKWAAQSDNSAILRIHVPKGANAAYVNASIGDDSSEETELLLPRGGRLKIVGIKDGVVHAELIK